MPDIVLFDYTALDTEAKSLVQQRAGEIKALIRRTAQDIIETGAKLIEVKDLLGYGMFERWVNNEFGWTQRTAYRFISVTERFASCDNLSQLAPSAMYMLSAPSTPVEAREEAIARADAGEVITHKVAKEIVQQHKAIHTHPTTITRTRTPKDPEPNQQEALGLWLIQVTARVTQFLQRDPGEEINSAFRAALIEAWREGKITLHNIL